MVTGTPTKNTALVLSGGGARGAYEVGIVKGILEVLGRGSHDPAPFSIFSGTSVGAINATFLAANAHRGDLAIDALIELWSSLEPRAHSRFNRAPCRSQALLDLSALESLVRRGINQDALDRNVANGLVEALIVPALHVASGQTALFVYRRDEQPYVPAHEPRRVVVRDRITADHVLASAAIPGVFPPRELGGRHFYDGGLRFNTPLAPAIRAGATKLVIVSPMHALPDCPTTGCMDDLGPEPATTTPSMSFLAGKTLHALLLDPFVHDIDVLQNFNKLLHVLDTLLSPQQRDAFDRATAQIFGKPYRHLDALVLAPQTDLGKLGADYLASARDRLRRSGWFGWMLSKFSTGSQSDLPSYMLFDGAFARQLIEAGRNDAKQRAPEIRALLARSTWQPPKQSVSSRHQENSP